MKFKLFSFSLALSLMAINLNLLAMKKNEEKISNSKELINNQISKSNSMLPEDIIRVLQNLIISYLDNWEIYKKFHNFAPEEIPHKGMKIEQGVLAIAFSPVNSEVNPYGRLIATVFNDNRIKLWDSNDLRCINTLPGHESHIFSLVFSKNGKYLASGSVDTTIKIWDCGIGKCINTLKGHTNEIKSIDYSPDTDSKYLASGSTDKTVIIWDTNSGSIIKKFDSNQFVTSVKYSLNGKYIILSGLDKLNCYLKVWNINNDSFLTIPLVNTECIYRANISQDSKYLVYGGSQKIKILNLEGDFIKELPDKDNSVLTSLTFTKDDKYIISTGYDKKVKIWNFQIGACVQTLEDYNDIIFSMDLSNDNIFMVIGDGEGFVHIYKNQANELIHSSFKLVT